MASTVDTSYNIIREVTPGTTPATPAFKTLAASPDSSMTYGGSELLPDVVLANRALAGATFTNNIGGGSLTIQAGRDTTTEMLIEAVLGSAFVSNVCKGGNTDISHTIEKKMVHNGVAMYQRATGAYFNKMTFSVDSGNNARFSFDTMYQGRTSGSSIITGATYTPATRGKTLTANDVGAITVGSISGVYSSLQMTITQDREPFYALGSANPVAITASASPRTVRLTAKMLRSSIDIDALYNTIVPVSIPIGSGTGNMLTLNMPQMVCSFPADEVSGSSLLVSMDLVAINDSALGSEISVTRS